MFKPEAVGVGGDLLDVVARQRRVPQSREERVVGQALVQSPEHVNEVLLLPVGGPLAGRFQIRILYNERQVLMSPNFANWIGDQLDAS